MSEEKKHEVPGGTVTTHADGSATIEGEAIKIEIDEDGKPRLKMLKPIKKICIDNIIDINTHTIDRSERATSHHITLQSGGSVRVTYRNDGKLLEFSVDDAGLEIKPGGTLVIVRK